MLPKMQHVLFYAKKNTFPKASVIPNEQNEGVPFLPRKELEPRLSFRASETSRGIYAVFLCCAAIRCEDPSTPLRSAQDDILFRKVFISTVIPSE